MEKFQLPLKCDTDPRVELERHVYLLKGCAFGKEKTEFILKKFPAKKTVKTSKLKGGHLEMLTTMNFSAEKDKVDEMLYRFPNQMGSVLFYKKVQELGMLYRFQKKTHTLVVDEIINDPFEEKADDSES